MILRRAMMNDKIVNQSGKNLLLEKCKGSYFNGLSLYGKSTQFTTTGAQLLDLSDQIGRTDTKNGATYKINVDQSVTVSGKPTKYTSFYLKNMSLKAGTYFLNNNVQSNIVFVQLIGNGIKTGVFTLDEDLTDISVYIVFNVQENNDKYFDFTFITMLNKGEEALFYEPYTGGKPSPSIEYPQEIENAGDDGEIDVKITGRNIAKDMGLRGNINGDESIVITENGIRNLYVAEVVSGQEIFVKDTEVIGFYTEYPRNGLKGVTGERIVIDKTKLIVPNGAIYVCVGTVGKKPMITIGQDEPTSFEPYKEPQSITLKTPNGLPGIPVSSGGNYIDETGQQWVCDEIDLERGVYVQRIKRMVFDGTESWAHRTTTTNNNNNFQIRIKDCPSAINKKCLCTHLPYKNVAWDDDPENLPKIYANDEEITVSFTSESEFNSLDSWLDFLKKRSPEFIYILKTPIETPLAPEVIETYRKLHTNNPVTTVLNDAGAYMSVKYRKVRG